jgi:hypothetical protein
MDFAAFAANAFRDNRSTALTLGVGTVVVTHTAMFLMPSDDTDKGAKQTHAITNLAAAAAIIWGSRLV